MTPEPHRHTLLYATTLMLEVLQVRGEEPGMPAQRPDLERARDILRAGQRIVNLEVLAAAAFACTGAGTIIALGPVADLVLPSEGQPTLRQLRDARTWGRLEADLHHLRARVLHLLARNELKIAQIARATSSTRAGLQPVLDALCKEGFIERHAGLHGVNPDREHVARRYRATVLGLRACRACGCTDDWACDEGCSWAEPDLCSGCTPGVEA